MKTLVKILVIVVVGLMVLGGVTFFFRNSLIAGVISKAGTVALGTSTKVEGVQTDMGSGAFALRGLELGNPDGFAAGSIFSFTEAATDLPLGNLRKDPLVIERVALTGLNVSLERKDGKFNYEPILAHLQQFGGKSDDTPAEAEQPAEEAGPGRTIRIERIDIADWTLQLDLTPKLQLDPLKLEGWTIEDLEVGGDQATAELVGRLFNEVLERVLSEGLPGIPADVLTQIGPELEALKGSLTGGLSELGGDLRGQLGGALEQGQEQLDDALQQGQGELENLLEGGKGALGEQLEGLEGAKDDLLEDAEGALKKGLGGLLGGKQDG